MRIITANVNGIRAAARKGFFDWLPKQNADVVCIQETKAQVHQLEDDIFRPQGYHCYYHDAEKKGYSGVALYCKAEPDEVIVGMGNEEFDAEGRYIEARFGNLSVISLYMPSGSSKEERQLVKYRCMDFFEIKMQEMKDSGRDVLICGDWNIAHKNEDIRNWKGNLKNSGFLPEERAWLDKLFDDMGFIDAFRELPQEEHQYTWWSNRGQARANNVGWRIDYHILTPSMKGKVKATEIYRDESFSDHAPLIIDYDYELAE
ncbi:MULTISPECIES: exodeoxyribonuclease III [unclassified Methylophaga]|jgi:exodeoxyribonuclease-3|uniref:exodeoxyribonuclease III n=2 Tax=Methylophaga TaxID=40222 RepID=UPI000C66CEF5|nr:MULTISPECIES: exodeoxyribonuclease III [unclassified Methylophaga]MAX53547.1 exodeoxyribonuclease III [Methylophaga sp.]|tara:strand:+ start:767 stop:1546 length:780 start_codon:yes stop_codon:yes gene_type:complete